MNDEKNISNFNKNEYKNLNILNFTHNYILNNPLNKNQIKINNNRIKSVREFYDNIIRISPTDFYYNTNRSKNENKINQERKDKIENEINNQIVNNIPSNHLLTNKNDINFNNNEMENLKYSIRKHNNYSSNYDFICNNNYYNNWYCNTQKNNEEFYYRLTNYY